MSLTGISTNRTALQTAASLNDAKSHRVSYSLPDLLDPLPDESMCGLAMRYAAIYRFAVPERLFNRLRMTRRLLTAFANLDPSSEQGRAVTTLLNIPSPWTASMSTWHPEALFVSVAGNRISVDLTTLNSRQCCPACLRQSPHHRNFWLLAAVPVCPEHRLRLVRKCPACSARLSWRGHGPHLCSSAACGFDLRDAHPEPAAEAASSAAAMLRSIYAGQPHASGLGLNETIEASLVLGAHLLGLKRQRRLAALISSPDVDLAAVLGNGGALLEPWPTAWHAFLGKELGRRFQGLIIPSLRAAFGQIHVLLRSPGGWRTALGDELARYDVGRREITVKKGRTISRAIESEPSRWLCLEEVAEKLGVSRSAASLISVAEYERAR